MKGCIITALFVTCMAITGCKSLDQAPESASGSSTPSANATGTGKSNSTVKTSALKHKRHFKRHRRFNRRAVHRIHR